MSSDVDVAQINQLVERQREESEVRFRRAQKTRFVLQNVGIVVPFALIFIIGLVAVPNFASFSNLTNILVNSGILAVIGFGMTIVVAMRGIDLSVGSAQALVACATALSINTFGLIPGVFFGLLLGLCLGAVNGLMITYLKVPDFIATLSTLSVYRGAVLILTAGAPVMITSASFRTFATSAVFGIPLPFAASIIVAMLVWFTLYKVPFGKAVVAVGTNPAAAVDSGISIIKLIILGYAFSGLLAGVGGVLVASQLGVVNGSISAGLELQAIAIVVLGGTSMMGGRPRVVGTFVAAMLLSTINSALNLLNVPSFYQYVALGVLLIFALTVDSAQRYAVKRLLQGR